MKAAVSLLLAAALALPGAAYADSKGKGNGKKARGVPGVEAQASQTAVILITATERAIIFGWLDSHRGNLPVALAGAKPLPPGIAKKVARGGALPPGIAKRYLPNDLLVQLPARPGYQWMVAGTDVLLVAAATGLIVDILIDAL
ncbi:MAG: anti-virulence regulator CigR family protein [Dongiaceae bacterium]